MHVTGVAIICVARCGLSRSSRTCLLIIFFSFPLCAANPAWSDSYLHQWLIEHGFIKIDAQLTPEKMLQKLVA